MLRKDSFSRSGCHSVLKTPFEYISDYGSSTEQSKLENLFRLHGQYFNF